MAKCVKITHYLLLGGKGWSQGDYYAVPDKYRSAGGEVGGTAQAGGWRGSAQGGGWGQGGGYAVPAKYKGSANRGSTNF